MHIILGGRSIFHFIPHRECEGEVETQATKHTPPAGGGAGLMRDDGTYLGEITAVTPGKMERFILFYNVSDGDAKPEGEPEPELEPEALAEIDRELLDYLLKDRLPARAYNSIVEAKVDVCASSDERILSLVGVGPKCLDTIREVVGEAAVGEA